MSRFYSCGVTIPTCSSSSNGNLSSMPYARPPPVSAGSRKCPGFSLLQDIGVVLSEGTDEEVFDLLRLVSEVIG